MVVGLEEPELELEVPELEEPEVGSIVLQLSVRQLQWDKK